VYGMEVTNPSLQFFPIAVYIEAKGAYHYAFFFYESLANTIVAILLFINAWKNPNKPNGVNSACYFISYGLVRSIMEPLRDNQFILQGGGVRWSLVFSLLILLFGMLLLFFVLYVNKRKEGVLFGSKRGEPYGISKYIKDTKEEIPYKNKINMMCTIRIIFKFITIQIHKTNYRKRNTITSINMTVSIIHNT
jgi:prolipoprotein diacylglyceryltransferase